MDLDYGPEPLALQTLAGDAAHARRWPQTGLLVAIRAPIPAQSQKPTPARSITVSSLHDHSSRQYLTQKSVTADTRWPAGFDHAAAGVVTEDPGPRTPAAIHVVTKKPV
ncbi:hypothetical protein [Streptomyces mirabilis]|uniref:hypothetical protein n=1 Tax=Streptomyces mirabilis TaxID=68239 RepID=UPI003329E088